MVESGTKVSVLKGMLYYMIAIKGRGEVTPLPLELRLANWLCLYQVAKSAF